MENKSNGIPSYKGNDDLVKMENLSINTYKSNEMFEMKGEGSIENQWLQKSEKKLIYDLFNHFTELKETNPKIDVWNEIESNISVKKLNKNRKQLIKALHNYNYSLKTQKKKKKIKNDINTNEIFKNDEIITNGHENFNNIIRQNTSMFPENIEYKEKSNNQYNQTNNQSNLDVLSMATEKKNLK